MRAIKSLSQAAASGWRASQALGAGSASMRMKASKHVGAVRNLNLHEYQSKIVMEKFDVNVQRGKEATTADAAKVVAADIKAQSKWELERFVCLLFGWFGLHVS